MEKSRLPAIVDNVKGDGEVVKIYAGNKSFWRTRYRNSLIIYWDAADRLSINIECATFKSKYLLYSFSLQIVCLVMNFLQGSN